MKIIFDKGLATEVELPISNYFEHLSSKTFNASKSFDLAKGEEVPDIKKMVDRKTFESFEIISDSSTRLPIIATYDKIDDFNTSYFEQDGIFSYNIALGRS